MPPAVWIFALTYLGVAIGGVPGWAIDRTGIALLGAIAMVASGALDEQAALKAIDLPTILLLFSLMVISSQLALGGFYTHVAASLERSLGRPRRFLVLLMIAAAGLSAVLTNDVVCLALAPLVAAATLRAGISPAPHLLGLAAAANIGSAATIIGNPQNILIGQYGRLNFGHHLAWCAVPVVLALAAAVAGLLIAYRGRFDQVSKEPRPVAGTASYDPHQSRKGLFATGVVMVLFFTPLPREIVALCAAGWLLCSRRMSTRALLGEVDWHLITLFCGLFIVIAGLEKTGWPARLMTGLAEGGFDLAHPGILTATSVMLSNLVSNVPATMLLTKFLDPAHPLPWYVLALTSTFAGNLITIGSIANLIVIEQARLAGVSISFREHARTGVPITLVSLAIVLGWVALMT